MNTKRRLAGVLGVLMALCLVGSLVGTPVLASNDVPEMDHWFFGEVTSNGEPVDEGVPIEARIKITSELCGSTTVYVLDEWNYNYNFDVLGTVASPGDLIEFEVSGVKAELYDADGEYLGSSYPFGSNDFRTELNLMLTVPDTTPPTVGITIADPVNLANVGAVAVTITSDEDGIYSYVIITDGVIEITYTDAIIADEPVELSLDLSTLADGPITADASVEDATGNVGQALQASATKDTTPPTVLSTTPEADATGMPVDTVVTATFSEAMSVPSAPVLHISPSVGGCYSWVGNVMTFTPDTALAYDTTYTVTITDAQDVAGNPLAEAEVWSFTTATEAIVPVSTLLEGWNLLSTPILLDADSDSMGQIFDAESLASIEISYSWDAVNEDWDQLTNDYELLPLYGIYVKISSGASATAKFIPSDEKSEPPSRELQPGLNLIGPAPVLDDSPDMPLDEALASIAEAADDLRGYTMVISPAYNQPPWTYGLGGDIEALMPFQGYWVVMENADTLFGFSYTPLQ